MSIPPFVCSFPQMLKMPFGPVSSRMDCVSIIRINGFWDITCELNVLTFNFSSCSLDANQCHCMGHNVMRRCTSQACQISPDIPNHIWWTEEQMNRKGVIHYHSSSFPLININTFSIWFIYIHNPCLEYILRQTLFFVTFLCVSVLGVVSVCWRTRVCSRDHHTSSQLCQRGCEMGAQEARRGVSS